MTSKLLCASKRLFVFILVFLFLGMGLPCFVRSQVIFDRIAAVVNDSVITLSDVNIVLSFRILDREGTAPIKEPVAVLNQLINQKLVIGLTKDSLPFDAGAIEEAYQTLVVRLGESNVNSLFEQFGLHKEDLQPYLYENILYKRIIEDRFNLAVRVSLKEIEEFYANQYIPQRQSRGEDVVPLIDVLEVIETAIKQEKIRVLVDEWLNNLRREADIQIHLKEERS